MVGPVLPGSVLCPKHWGLKPIDYSHAREFCLGQAINFWFFLCPKVERIFDFVGAGLLAMGSTRLSRPTAAPASRASPLPQRCGLQFQSFRTTFRFHSRESSERIPLACACSNRGIVSAHRCKSAVGFSSLVDEQGARRHLSEALFFGPALWWPCAGRLRARRFS